MRLPCKTLRIIRALRPGALSGPPNAACSTPPSIEKSAMLDGVLAGRRPPLNTPRPPQRRVLRFFMVRGVPYFLSAARAEMQAVCII